MSKIEPIGGDIHWGPEAALHAALEVAKPDDKVVVIIGNKECGNQTYYCANTMRAEVIYMIELHKIKMLETNQEWD